MVLRHGKNPVPAWTAGCAGPFLISIGLLDAVLIAFGKPLTFGDGVSLFLTLVLAGAGVWLTIDHFRNK